MIKNRPNIYIVNESIKICRDVRFGSLINPFMPTGAFNICCPRDAVSRSANVELTVRLKWAKKKYGPT